MMRAAAPNASVRAPGADAPVTHERQPGAAHTHAPVLAVGFSGGGDSTALLIALRAGCPDAALHALIVDHRLRPESAAEAELAAARARALGATPHILVWDAPRPGQGAARQARHRLMALACRRLGAAMLCLGHTLDDRIETLRMRAARGGAGRTLAAMGPVSASPVWPEGRGLTIARPLLGLRRSDLRAALTRLQADWIEDPSNTDARYERVRMRLSPLSPEDETALLKAGDAALDVASQTGAASADLAAKAAALTHWGGAQLSRSAILDAAAPVRLRALSVLLTAVSGGRAGPAPALTHRFLGALEDHSAMTGAGVHLTVCGILGRDPGAAGRADGAPIVAPLQLEPGDTGVFDGRYEVTATASMRLEWLGARRPGLGEADAPGVLRPGLILAGTPDGPVLAGAEGPGRWLVRDRMDSLTLPPALPTWFDGANVHARACAALEIGPVQPHI
ncbi:MAG: tRNA lysidine(34) synthetase TilS [Oceanicaulis sp.]